MTTLPEIGALYQHQASGKNYHFYGMGTTLSPLDPHELNTPVNVYLDPEQPDNRFALIVTHERVEDWHLFMVVESASDVSIAQGINVAVYGGERNWVRTMEEFRGDKDGKPRFRKLEPVTLNYFAKPIEWDLRSKGSSEHEALPTARFGISMHVDPGLLPYLTMGKLQISDQIVVEFNKTLDDHTRIDIWFTALDGRRSDWDTRSLVKRLAQPVLEYVNSILNRKLALLPTDGPGSFLA